MNDPRASRPLWWRLYERLAMCIGLASLALVCLSWLPFAAVLHPILPRRIGQRLGRLAIMVGFRIYLRILTLLCACRFDLSALDALRDERSLIIAPNHPSLLDAVVLASRLPHAVCVMKASLLDNLLFGAGARLARYIRNDSAHRLIKRGCKSLQEGAQLVLFPEGTRTEHFPLNPLGQSTGLIARRARAPVQTVLLEFSTPYLGKHWPLWRPPVLPLTCRARLGRRFPPPDDHKAFTRELELYLREALTMNEHPTP
ncbi:MAG: lysophospholipid acyltransferase family protein [Hydrogenophaga sp.]|jgi:1-acyl-sn-glycerol-3-phosphate acyltransferase|uniref:lysophospholipid acyltransferase family protein n=1 Tax=Hydrogenophaga sp. TaxID=1904254 RepID=UPI000ED95095|nr:lysophospholipid acyltransferase family protein [Hydrogenophaga sp.]MDD3786431.1 lysophospholipid acyltransferase family protein [Hydrogenophaga sp.]HAJ11328.1 1-acyl-sn-glycerol-3-phosphate acyltransferase [Comamonadaceae bacterium]